MINKAIENFQNLDNLNYSEYDNFDINNATDTERSRIYDWCSSLLVKQCCTVRNTCSHFGFDSENYPECQMLSNEQRQNCPGLNR
jgi:hypothetical protein